MSTKITIFGGDGFLGRHIIRRLAKTGATIRVPTRDPEKALLLRPMGDVGQIVPFPCQVRGEAAVAKAIGDTDIVINLIGILYESGRETFQGVHVETAARIARLAKAQGAKRLIHISALGADAHSKSSYARSKALGEQAARTFFPDVTILRPSIVFGPEDNFFNQFASMARFLPALPLIGGGHTKFQPVYVGDIGLAVLAALQKSETIGRTYEFGGPQIYSFKELLEIILNITARKRCLFNVPWGMAKLQATFLGLMPKPLLTRDQVELLKTDNVLSGTLPGLIDLDVTPTAVEVIVPEYLARYRSNDAVALRAY